MKTHKDLDVWKLSIDFTENIYLLTKQFPKEETYGLIQQIRRAAISIGANIAEGAARQTNKEFTRFLYIARGSASEVNTLLEISKRIHMTGKDKLEIIEQQNTKILKMLTALINSINARNHQLPVT